MPHPSGLITLLTDFGDRDWFVASLKGVILTINPQATIVDLSHHISSHAIEEGAYVLKSCYRYFPEGTIHVAVVDPGVGSRRRPLIVKSSRFFFLAPDNGLLTHVFEEEKDLEVRAIENKQYCLESGGATFDGRDTFAPAAAWLTRRQPYASFGGLLDHYQTFSVSLPRWERQSLVGEVLYVDRFGNLITNLTRRHVDEVQAVAKRPHVSILLAGHAIEGLRQNYAEGEVDTPHALINSDGLLEIFLAQASASARLKAGAHAVVKLS